MNKNNISKIIFNLIPFFMVYNCSGVKPQVPAHAVSKKEKTGAVVKINHELSKTNATNNKNPEPEYVFTVKAPVNINKEEKNLGSSKINERSLKLRNC